MKNKKGSGTIWFFAILGVVLVGLVGYMVFTGGGGTSQTVVQENAKDIAQATKSGDVASVGVYVYDNSNNDKNTKIGGANIYCQEKGSGKFIIDATASSATAEITGKTVIGEKIKCWAFNSTFQTLEPVEVDVTGESVHIVIDGFTSLGAGYGNIKFFDDSFASAGVNISVSASSTSTFQKMRFTNNGTDTSYNLGGFYFDTIESSNVSLIDITGGATVSGVSGKTSTNIVDSDLATDVSGRRTSWDFVFEVDDDSGKAGNQPIYLEENDYIETGSVSVTADSSGCQAGAGDPVTTYGFAKGWYRSAKSGEGVKFGHESDAQSPSAIVTDIAGTTDNGIFYCQA